MEEKKEKEATYGHDGGGIDGHGHVVAGVAVDVHRRVDRRVVRHIALMLVGRSEQVMVSSVLGVLTEERIVLQSQMFDSRPFTTKDAPLHDPSCCAFAVAARLANLGNVADCAAAGLGEAPKKLRNCSCYL